MMKMKPILFLFALLALLFASLVSGQALPECATLPAAQQNPGVNCVDAGGIYIGGNIGGGTVSQTSTASADSAVAGVAGALGLAGVLAVAM